MAHHTAFMRLKKVTSAGACSYNTVDEDGNVVQRFNSVPIANVYLRDFTFPNKQPPKNISVTVSWDD